VGVILFEIFTGRLPFEDKDPIEQAMKHLNQPVPPPRSLRPEISPQVEAVILKLLAKSPEDRYPNGAALIKALSAALKSQVEPEAPPPSTISALTIAERVRLQTATQPLPALPTPANRPAVEHLPADVVKPSPPARSRSGFPLLAVAGVAGFLVFVFLCAWMMVAGLRFGSQILRGNGEPAVTGTALAVTSPTSVSPPLTTTYPPPTATSTSAPQVEYRLHIEKRGQDGLIVLNAGQFGLSLERIQLGNPPNYILGSQWDHSTLQPGECVLVRAEGVKGNKLKKVDCEQAGIELGFPDERPFWSSYFNIYFDGEFIGSCEQALAECEIIFPDLP
jgi:serine/threonine protein kinase